MGRVCGAWTTTPTSPTTLPPVGTTVPSSSGTAGSWTRPSLSGRTTPTGMGNGTGTALVWGSDLHPPFPRIWSVQYNLFHDQLVLTASSDSQVVLTRMVSIASEPLRHIEEDENGYECHNRPSHFATLSAVGFPLLSAPPPPRRTRSSNATRSTRTLCTLRCGARRTPGCSPPSATTEDWSSTTSPTKRSLPYSPHSTCHHGNKQPDLEPPHYYLYVKYMYRSMILAAVLCTQAEGVSSMETVPGRLQ